MYTLDNGKIYLPENLQPKPALPSLHIRDFLRHREHNSTFTLRISAANLLLRTTKLNDKKMRTSHERSPVGKFTSLFTSELLAQWRGKLHLAAACEQIVTHNVSGSDFAVAEQRQVRNVETDFCHSGEICGINDFGGCEVNCQSLTSGESPVKGWWKFKMVLG